MKKHSFSVEIATHLQSIEKAIILDNFAYWITKNLANNSNIHDGKVYTYNSYDALLELFPYMKLNTIKRVVRELENDNILSSRTDLNKTKWNKTKWYTIEDDFIAKYLFTDSEMSKLSIVRKITIKGDINNYQSSEKQPSLIGSNINTNINTNNKQQKRDEQKKNSDEFIKFINELSSLVNIPSKVKLIGEEVFNTITNKQLLKESYITHQLEKGDYAKSFINYMKDFNKFHSKNISPAVPKVENKYVLSCS